MRCFIDTNIWIYAIGISEKKEERIKRGKIEVFFKNLKDDIIISVQVLNELFYVLNRKEKISIKKFREIERKIESITNIVPVNLETHKRALKIFKDYNISWWDSLLIASAIEHKCINFYTENLSHAQKIENLKIINPFKLKI